MKLTEIEAKARQLARVKTAPDGSYDVCKEAIALEMADWMTNRIKDKASEWFNEVFFDNSHSSGRGRYCEIVTHDYDSIDDIIKDFCKVVLGYES